MNDKDAANVYSAAASMAAVWTDSPGTTHRHSRKIERVKQQAYARIPEGSPLDAASEVKQTIEALDGDAERLNRLAVHLRG